MRRGVLLLLATAAVALPACATGDDNGTDRGPDDPVAALVKVPDVGRQDGATAVAAVEKDGFKTSLEEVEGDTPGSSFKAAGCTVTGQDPPGGSRAKRGGVVTLTLDCGERDWEAETGDAWQLFDTAYRSGFDAGCRRLFSLTATGLLGNAGTDLKLGDCEHLNPHDAGKANTIPTKLPQDPKAAGRRYGISDGCGALFDDQGVDELDAGDGAAVVTAADCEKAKAPAASAMACDPVKVNGDEIQITPEHGKIDCDAAAKAWSDYVTTQSSGGSAAPGEWKCTTADKPLLGRCDDAAGDSFTVAQP